MFVYRQTRKRETRESEDPEQFFPSLANICRGRDDRIQRKRKRKSDKRTCAIKGGQLFITDGAGALEKCKGVELSLTLRWPRPSESVAGER